MYHLDGSGLVLGWDIVGTFAVEAGFRPVIGTTTCYQGGSEDGEGEARLVFSHLLPVARTNESQSALIHHRR